MRHLKALCARFFLDLRAKPGVKALSTYATASWVANRNIKEGE
jgi:hypothetical protein